MELGVLFFCAAMVRVEIRRSPFLFFIHTLAIKPQKFVNLIARNVWHLIDPKLIAPVRYYPKFVDEQSRLSMKIPRQ
jgi:hypothetical protein